MPSAMVHDRCQNPIGRLVIVGCGNPNRSDDGVGPDVVARLGTVSLPPNVDVYDTGTDGIAVMYRLRNASHLVIVDAQAPGNSPGAIYEVPGDILRTAPPASFNLHDFRWNNALYAGWKMYGDDFPAHVKVLLIEAGSLDFGLELSAPVRRAAETVCARLTELANAFAAGAWS